MGEGSVRIRMTMTHRKSGRYPYDYTATNARDFNDLKGIKLIEANLTRNGKLIAVFEVPALDVRVKKSLKWLADVVLTSEDEPQTIKYEKLGGGIEPLPDPKILPMPDFAKD
jgi:hypothetical protein